MRVHSIREGKVFNWIDRGEARLVEGGRPLGVADLNHDAFDIENKIDFENGLEGHKVQASRMPNLINQGNINLLIFKKHCLFLLFSNTDLQKTLAFIGI